MGAGKLSLWIGGIFAKTPNLEFFQAAFSDLLKLNHVGMLDIGATRKRTNLKKLENLTQVL